MVEAGTLIQYKYKYMYYSMRFDFVFDFNLSPLLHKIKYIFSINQYKIGAMKGSILLEKKKGPCCHQRLKSSQYDHEGWRMRNGNSPGVFIQLRYTTSSA